MPSLHERSHRRLLIRAVVAVVAFGLIGAACLPAAPPPPQNGRLPDSSLTFISDGCRVATELAGPLVVLLRAASIAGVALAPEKSAYLPPGVPAPPRIESCYRTYDMQVWWRNYYCSIGQCGMAAVPGTSKHGWGHAIDFEDQGGELTFSSPGYAWLAANAAGYGFFQPASVQPGGPNPEAWHWEA
jgi:hypothetical protein